jgi:hypothetical protein
MHDDAQRPDNSDPSPTPRSTEPPETPGALGRLLQGAGSAAEPIVDGVTAAIGAAADAAGAAAGAAASTISDAATSIGELPGMRVRRVRRLARDPLPSLPELYPESARARPVVIGLRSIPVSQIRGTAVGGGGQRGGDFLPLKPFRSKNWQSRWERLRRAQDALAILPPIDVVKFDDGYWVVDGHNRTALALYANQPEIDASVVELVPPGESRTEPIGTLEAEVDAARPVRRLTQHEPSHPRDEPA